MELGKDKTLANTNIPLPINFILQMLIIKHLKYLNSTLKAISPSTNTHMYIKSMCTFKNDDLRSYMFICTYVHTQICGDALTSQNEVNNSHAVGYFKDPVIFFLLVHALCGLLVTLVVWPTFGDH